MKNIYFKPARFKQELSERMGWRLKCGWGF
jgi:hypothetical protein